MSLASSEAACRLVDLPDLAYIALGSNLGDSVGTIRQAYEDLQAWSDEPVLESSLWQTMPVDCPPGSPPFINAMAGLAPRTLETPESLLARMQELERAFGRKPKQVSNESRPLDLDLITFGGLTRNSPTLCLPHPRAHCRRFVLQPLSEIAPNLILPGQSKTVAELLAALRTDESISRIANPA
jgi:2-amino-4-hydroxy-6-hydroxymethyldihydropteridine diphosphokinase